MYPLSLSLSLVYEIVSLVLHFRCASVYGGYRLWIAKYGPLYPYSRILHAAPGIIVHPHVYIDYSVRFTYSKMPFRYVVHFHW